MFNPDLPPADPDDPSNSGEAANPSDDGAEREGRLAQARRRIALGRAGVSRALTLATLDPVARLATGQSPIDIDALPESSRLRRMRDSAAGQRARSLAESRAGKITAATVALAAGAVAARYEIVNPESVAEFMTPGPEDPRIDMQPVDRSRRDDEPEADDDRHDPPTAA